MNIVKIPLSFLYRFLLLFRSALYKYKLIKTHQFNVPIVSVGNIVFGGSGKTPFINWIYKELSDSYNVCIITRGYGRKNNNINTLNEGIIIPFFYNVFNACLHLTLLSYE